MAWGRLPSLAAWWSIGAIVVAASPATEGEDKRLQKSAREHIELAYDSMKKRSDPGFAEAVFVMHSQSKGEKGPVLMQKVRVMTSFTIKKYYVRIDHELDKIHQYWKQIILFDGSAVFT